MLHPVAEVSTGLAEKVGAAVKDVAEVLEGLDEHLDAGPDPAVDHCELYHLVLAMQVVGDGKCTAGLVVVLTFEEVREC